MNLSSRYQEEMEYRRLLFKAAAKGDLRAQEALEREYHVRVLRKKHADTRIVVRRVRKWIARESPIEPKGRTILSEKVRRVWCHKRALANGSLKS